MIIKSRLSTAVTMALMTSAAIITATQPTFAAQQHTASQPIEKLTVTGSRIIREGATAPTPVTVVTGAELLSTGVTNIGEALNQLPALGNTYSLASSNGIGTSGLNILDLRNLGTDRTLVLVDGRRHVSSSSGSASVDINTIPSTWVEKVEIITGGASAVYGADAVTGVVNFILKKHITGLDASMTTGVAADSGFNKNRLALSYGTDFDDSRGNVATTIEYSGQSRLNALERAQTATSFASIRNPDAKVDSNPNKLFTPNAGYYLISNAGNFDVGDDTWRSFNPDGSLKTLYLGTSSDERYCADCDFVNLSQFTNLQPAFERYNVNLKANYEFSDTMSGYMEAKYVRSTSQDIRQPAFFFYSPENTISLENAFMQTDLSTLMADQGLTSLTINRFMTDLGLRIEDNTRETQRYVLGLKGTVLDDWNYDAALVYGQTDLTRANKNNLIRANYANALDSILINGEAVCRDETARAAGCVPINIFGDGNVSQEASDYINTTSIGHSIIQQTVVSGSMSNSYLLPLPAGYLGFAAGIEYRKEQSEVFEPENAVGTFFNVLGEDKGQFTVKEVFSEITIPLLADLPLIKQLDTEFAVRFANYSTIGDATTWKTGLNWTLDDSLRLRSTYSKAIRAPNISELFGAPSENFYHVKDKCKASELAQLEDPTLRTQNCAALGVATSFDSSYDSAFIKGTSGGNTDLESEESKSYTLGLVYQPSYIDSLVVSLDYWSIDINNAISTVSAQDIIDKCIDSPTGIDNAYCALLTRDATSNEITSITQHSLNIASLTAKGVDLDIGYNTPLFDGELKTNLIATRLIERKDFSFQDDPSEYEELAGVAGTPSLQANINLKYLINSWKITWRTRFIDGVSLYTDKDFRIEPNPSNLLGYKDYYISDIGAGYEFDNGITLTAGIDNLFDKALPYGSTGTSTKSSPYDNVGRFFHTTLSYKL